MRRSQINRLDSADDRREMDCHFGNMQTKAGRVMREESQSIEQSNPARAWYVSDDHISKRMIINKAARWRYAKLAYENYRYYAPRLFKPAPFAPRYMCEVDASLRLPGILHLLNSVNFGTMPYISTFESRLPRYFEDSEINMRLLISRMASSSCVAMLAASEFAYKFQIGFITPFLDGCLLDYLFSKTHILHPPQQILPRHSRTVDNMINFIFIGNDYFTKGGAEMLDAFKKLRNEYSNFHLYILSNFYIEPACNVLHAGDDDVKNAKQIIASMPWITLRENVPNEDALELIAKCHVGLLPSYLETYGFSVLEMQAAAVPVITTDIAAFPEINNDACGWIINLPSRDTLSASASAVTRQQYRQYAMNGLEAILKGIMTNPEAISAKGDSAQERIKEFHSPEKYGSDLEQFYKLAYKQFNSRAQYSE